MSSTYVKKYDVGQIKLDLPYANYIHELPLLSFGDIQHTINLSLVFNYARKHDGDCSFYIAEGFKLNLQKRIGFDACAGTPLEFIESNGKCISLSKNGDIYTFRDESQRILRKIGNTYEVEYPDFSKEVYNDHGYIAAVCDKYGNTILSYTYRDDDRLTNISYRGSKNIILGYNSSDQLATITYAGCPINFNYNDDRSLNFIKHYSEVYYTFDFSEGYEVMAGDTVGSAVNSASATIKSNDKTITVSDPYDNSTVYKFHNSIASSTLNQIVDIIDNNEVTTRVRFERDKALYQYGIEGLGANFGEDENYYNDRYLGNINVYATEDNIENSCNLTIQFPDNNDSMQFTSNNGIRHWERSNLQTADTKGYFVLTGWLKFNDNTGQCVFNMSNSILEFTIPRVAANQWQFFAYKFFNDGAITDIYTSYDANAVEARDFRLQYVATHLKSEKSSSHIAISEDVLKNNNTYIPIEKCTFYCDGVNISNNANVYFEDILRYQINQQKQINASEFYCDRSKTIVSGVSTVTFSYDENMYNLNDFTVCKRNYTNKGVLTTVYETGGYYLLSVYTMGQGILSMTLYDYNLDITSERRDGVDIDYFRKPNGLVYEQKITPVYEDDETPDANLEFTKKYTYNTSGTDDNKKYTKLVSVEDEFGNITSYTTDDTWGVVTAVTLPEGSVITDTYDGDMSVLKEKAFDNNETRKNVFAYSNGRLASITGGEVSYGFGYTTDKGELASVSKNGTGVEHHSYSESNGETTVVSKYPSSTSVLHTETTVYDKYGRLKSIEGVLTNVYDLNPFWCYFDGSGKDHKTMEGYDRTQHGELIHSSPTADGKDALLSEVTDSLANEITQYGYDNGKLTAAVTYNNQRNNDGSIDEESVLRQETFVYDDIGRVTKDKFTYEIMNPQTAEQEIVYATAVDSPTPDNRISSYTYKLNGNVKAQTTNAYDVYKRIKQKTYTVGGKSFIKKINYTKTRPTLVEDKCGNNNIASTAYGYDSMGRINSIKNMEYTYDTYGQLVEEKNTTLDKSTQYVYNGIGNIERIKKNGVTTQFGYDSTHPDRLVSYGNKAITYDNMGRVSNYDSWDYTWTRGKLSSIRKSSGGSSRALITPVLLPSKTYSFTYNGFGQRVSKSYSYFLTGEAIVPLQPGEVTHYTKQYHYDQSGRLLVELINETRYGDTDVSKSLKYLYDESGIIGVQYTSGANTNTYYYLRNLLGDVIGIYNTSGTKVVGYTYDAWGNCTIDSLTTNYELAHDNPIRYRGYYYDEDTGLYYLNSRYYNPEWRRFISPDDTAYIDPETPNGLNLYCYCGNDPVNYADPSGNDPEWWQWALFGVGVALVVTAALMVAVGSGGVAAFGMGALIGSAAVGGAGALIGGAVGYATGGVDGIIGGAMAGFGIGAIVGFAVGGIIGYANFGSFASQAKLETHFIKHGSEFGQMYPTSAEYAKGAKYVIRHGQKVKYMYKGKKTVGYIRFLGNAGKANYAFVGLNGTKVATYGVRSVQELAKLGISLFV